MRHVIVFRSRLRDGIADEYGPHAEKIYDLALHQPGFLAVKDFVAEDGERPGAGLDHLGRADGGDRLAHTLLIDDPMAGSLSRKQMHDPTMAWV